MKNTLNNEGLTIMKLENINFNGETYKLRVTRYSKSNFVAILMQEQGYDDEYPYPNVITTNNSVMEKDGNDDTEYVQIRTDEKQYAQLLIENGLIEERPDFIMPQGYIGIMFFAPTEEFSKYIKENVKP